MAPKPLVFVPGLPGSVILEVANHRTLFPNLLALFDPQLVAEMVAKLPGPDDPNANDGVVAGDPVASLIPGLKSSFIDFSGTLKQADSLYDLLGGLGYTQVSPPFGDRFRPIGWDWRRPVDGTQVQSDLKRAITELSDSTGEKVVILCHSTGGLVTRSLLEDSSGDTAFLARIDQVIAIAIPWAGTPQTLPYLSGQQGFGPLSSAQAQHILGRSWAAFDLLPPDPGKTDMTDAAGDLDFFTTAAGQTSPLVEMAWIPTGPTGVPFVARAKRSDMRFGARTKALNADIEVVSFAGWGVSTTTGCTMDAHGNLGFSTSDQGDGTIARRSAAWLQSPKVKTFYVPVGHYPDSQITREHSSLWLNPPVRDLLGVLLAGRPRPSYTYAAVDGDDAINSVPDVHVRFVAQDANGQPLTNAFAEVPGLASTQTPVGAEGRGVFRVRRQDIHQQVTGSLHRFEVHIHWQEGGQSQSVVQALLIQKP